MKAFFLAAAMLGAGSIACAQDHEAHRAADQPASATSAASMMGYSAQQRADGLREGRGMGLAMPAETNGYPGPRHVLEMADEIALTAEQRARTERLFESMRGEASRLGTRLLEQEAELNALFRDRRATLALLDSTARAIGETEAALKVAHLRTHLAMMDILTPDQVSRYVSLRRAGGGTGRTRPAQEAPAASKHGHRR